MRRQDTILYWSDRVELARKIGNEAEVERLIDMAPKNYRHSLRTANNKAKVKPKW